MDVIVYNPQKGRLETIKAHFTEETTTWFDGPGHPECVRMITDLNGNLLITRDGRDYPVIIYVVLVKSLENDVPIFVTY